MPLLSLKSLPRDEALIEVASRHPEMDPTACAVVLHLLRTGDEIFRVIDEHFSSHGLSEGRFTVLMLLSRNQCGKSCVDLKANTPAELAEFSGVTRATMTGLIDTLEKDGLVVRHPDPQDRRMMNVQITAKGAELLQRLLPGHFQLIASMMSVLNAQERTQLQQLLSKVLTHTAALKGQ